MSSNEIAVVLKRFESPDEVRVLQKGRFGGCASRRYDNRKGDLRTGLEVERPRRAECGRDSVPRRTRGDGPLRDGDSRFRQRDSRRIACRRAFYIPPVPHDSWVVGELPYVSLHFLGAAQYAMSNCD